MSNDVKTTRLISRLDYGKAASTVLRSADKLRRLHRHIRIDTISGCWEWLGYRKVRGYGQVHVDRGYYAAHRLLYSMFRGEPDPRLSTDHLCRNTACVNPFHLEMVSQRENLLRGNTIPAMHAAKTRCCHGHKFSTENTYIRGDGTRMCRKCHRDEQARYRAQKLAG